MKDFITKMTCTFLLLIGAWSLTAQTSVSREDIRDGIPFVPEEVNTLNGQTQVSPKVTKGPLYNNGPLVTHPGEGANGADVSAGSTLWGSGCQFVSNNWMADDFEVDQKWAIDQIEFFGYQTGSGTTSTMNGVYLAIFDTDPSTAGAEPIWGDFTTNIFESTSFINCYRILPSSEGMTSTSRPIMSLIGNTEGLVLEPGTYWLMTTWSGTGASGPWAPPVTIVGQPETGNSKQRQAGTWVPIEEDGYPQGLPFIIHGTVGGEEPFYDHYAPPTDVTATAKGNDVTVKWKAPEGVTIPSYTGWLQHCSENVQGGLGYTSGFNTGQEIECFARFTPDDLAEWEVTNNNKISKFSWFGSPGDITATMSYKLKIYQGGSAVGSTINPGTLVYEQDIASITANMWNDIELNTPVNINPNQELWFGISMTVVSGGYAFIMTFDSSGDADYTKNITRIDSDWFNMNDLASSYAMYNWMTRAYIVDQNGKAAELGKNAKDNGKAATYYYLEEYEVYCNDHLVGKTSGTSFTHQYGMVAGGELDYCVRSVFDDGGKSEFACAETLDAGAGTITINPGCLTSIKFTEDFETTSPTVGQWVNERVTGTTDWSVVPNTTGTPNTTPSGSTGRKARFYYSAGRGHVSRFISPAFDLSGSENAMLSFWHTQRVWLGDQDELRIYYAHSASGPWTQIAEYTQNIADWTEETITLPNPSATYYIAFEGTIDFGYGCQLDDVTVYGGEPDLPAPDAPVNLTAAFDELNWYNVNLNWEMYSTVGIAGYYLYRGGIILNYGAPVDKSIMKYLDVVPGAGTYLYEVQSISTDGCLSEKTPLTVVVEPDPCDGIKILSYPYTQGFEDSQNLLELCWRQEIMKGTVAWEIVSANTGTPATTHSGSQKIRYYYNGQLEQVSRLISPMFNFGGGGGLLTFWYTNQEWYLGQDVLRVYYKNKPNGDWILIETFNEDIDAWTQVTLDLPDNTETYWICFEGNTSQGYGVQLDDIKVEGCAIQIAPPYFEGFEANAPKLPVCWEQDILSGPGAWVVTSAGTPATTHSGAYKAYLNGDDDGTRANLFSGELKIRGGHDFYIYQFWYTNYAFLTYQDILHASYQTAADGEWNLLQTFNTNMGTTWNKARYILTDISNYFRAQFAGEINWGFGIGIDDVELVGCDNITLPFEETFDTKIPVCWENITTPADNAPWKFVTTGTSPTVSPHSAGGMLQYNNYSYTSGKKGQLYTEPMSIPRTEKYVEISFWMYRDNSGTYGSPTYQDHVNIYLTPNRSVDGFEPVYTVYRNKTLSPAVSGDDGWYLHSFVVDADLLPSRRVHIVLEGVSRNGNNVYVDDLSASIYRCEDNIATLPLVSSFEDGFPDICWDLAASSGSVKWTQIESRYGIDPQDGSYQIVSDCWSSYYGEHTELTTRPFYTEGKNQVASFWLYRSTSMNGYSDMLNIYLTEDGDISTATPLFSVGRHIESEPAVPKADWYQYYVELPCASMTTAKVTFQVVSEWGDDVLLDNVEIGDLCVPVQNVIAIGAGEIPYFWTEGHVTWEAPAAITESLSGYEVYRGETLLATVGPDIFEYIDDISNLPAGEYFYCVVATYDNDCGASESICAPDPIIKVTPCENAPMPHSLSAEKHVDEWYDIDLRWANPLGGAMSQVASDPAIAFGYWGDPIFMAVKFKPADLAPYSGSKISKITVALYEPNTEYTLKLYKGGSDLVPGTVIHTQTFNSSTYISSVEYAWVDIVLTNQITLDGSDYLWVELGSNSYPNYPVVFDNGPTTEAMFSDLLKLGADGEWASISSQGYSVNACIQVFIRTIEGNDEIIGFNVFRDDVLLTNPMLSGSITKYRDRVPGPGSYLYEVSAIYNTHCITDRASLTVEMEQSPCEVLWPLPIIESFDDFSRFPPWCWELDESDGPWQQVTSGSPPSVTPYSGAGMLMYNNYWYYYTTGLLISPKFATADNDYTLKFMMYRDNDGFYGSYADRVNIYVSDQPNITGLSPAYTAYRCMNMAPVVAEQGWHQISVQIPTSGMTSGAYVIFEGVSEYGNNTYVDDIMIVDEIACDPVYDIVVEQPNEGEVLISWSAPLNTGLTGYRVFRDGVLIANNLTETFITDYVSLGAHEYCITALFNKPECSESLPVCVTIDVFAQCDPVKSVTAEVVGMHKVQVSWIPTAAAGVTSYTVYRDGSMLAANVHETSYPDEGVPPGSHKYSVVVNYAAKPCQMSDIVDSNSVTVESCVPVTNLTYEQSGDVVTLNWDFDGKKDGNRDVVLSEGFENGIPSDWINLDVDGDGYIWCTEDPDFGSSMIWDPHSGAYAAGSQSWTDYFLMPLLGDNWLITPQLIFGKESKLTFWVGAQLASWFSEYYEVLISTSGTNPSDFTKVHGETLTSASYKEVTVDLADYKGFVYIAFRHVPTTDNFTIMIDDVEVTTVGGPMSYDIFKDGEFITNIDDQTWEDTGLQPGTYRYCVRPVYEQCTVDMACVDVIVEECILGDVTNVTAVQDKVEKPKRVDISWSYSGEPAEFQIQRSESGDFTTIGTISDMSFSDTDVEYNKSYTYCVKAVKEGCISGAIGCDNEIVEEPKGIETLESALNIYPNPASTTVTIEGGAIVEVEVYNAVGQLIDRIMAIEGETVKHINVAGYEAGAYIFRLFSADQKTINKPIMVAR